MIKNNNLTYCAYDDCSRKLKLTDFACKCKKIFCKLHKLPEEHNCEYDYKETNNKINKIKEMKCISKKINKI